MQTLLWSFMTYGVLSTGMATTALMLSGLATCERLGYRLSRVKFSLAASKDGLVKESGVPLPAVVIAIAALLVFMEYLALQALRSEKYMTKTELSAHVVRHQRNWWLGVFSLFVWATQWRLGHLVTSKRARAKALQAS